MRRTGAAIPTLCAAAVLLACGARSAYGATRTVLFPFELIDATQSAGAFGYDAPGGLPQGPSRAETERLARISADLRDRVAKDARFTLVPEADVASEVAAKQPISQCNGCEDDIAKAAGARLALVATVEKLSDLLFNFKLYLRDVREQKLTAVLSTTVQGSTDEAWARGVRHLAERQLHAAGVPE